MTVVAHVNQPATASRPAGFDALRKLCGKDMVKVNALIMERMQSDVGLIPQIAGYIIAAGGKRLRPMLTLASARLCGYRGEHHVALAATVEFIHTATLLHDDVVDDSALRRGQDSAKAIWGNQPSVLVGDFLFSRAFQLMVETGAMDVLRILSNASAVIAEGEVQQLVTANDTTTSVEAYLNVIESKTAALFAAACEVGAVIAGQPPTVQQNLADYGQNLGIAFQLVDDHLDYAANEQELGKPVGGDFRDGKLTLPVVLALQRGTTEERNFWKRTLEDQNQRDGDFQQAGGILRRYGAMDDTLELARTYVDRACNALEALPPSRYRDALHDCAAHSVERAY